LHLDDVSNALEIIFDVLDAVVIFDHSRHSKIKAAEDNFLLDVLDKSLNVCIYFTCVYVSDVAVNEAVSNALAGVTQDLMV
jgi:hypothetical protein